MAEIQAFRGWRYAEKYTPSIEELASPLFDVVSDKQRERLYANPLNSIHLSVPRGDNIIEKSGSLVRQWKSDGTLSRDPLPAIYVYYQYFSLPGVHRTFCRKGFICNIRAYDWEDQVILRHENTMPAAVNDRVDILNATQMNISATHGLYTDELHQLEPYMDESMESPLYDIEDYQGVRDVLSVIQDKHVIDKFIRVISEKQIILADGHHRYAGALEYKNQQNNPPDHGSNFHMMYLTNTESDDLVILPTHRVIQNVPDFDAAELLRRLNEYFHIKPIDEPHTAQEMIAGKEKAFALLLPDEGWKLRLKDGLQIPWKFDPYVNQLDITSMHYFILDRGLGIPGKTHTTSPYIDFDRSFSDVLARVNRSEVQAAIVTNDISMEDIKKVCYSGSVMPQKTTFFYPKVVCGFVFSSIEDEEFSENNIACL